MKNSMTEAEKIVRDFIYNSYLSSVVDSDYVEPTSKDIENFINARQKIPIDEYRRISSEETERFKKEYDL